MMLCPRLSYDVQEELAEAKEQIRQAAQNAEAASKKAENLEWKLRMQEATLAERSRVADEAKQLTTGLSEVCTLIVLCPCIHAST